MKSPRKPTDPEFIPGIYNYCDSWCDRCAHTSRCYHFAHLAELEDHYGDGMHDMQNDTFWQVLRDSFADAREMLLQIAAERGINVDFSSEELSALNREIHTNSEAARKNVLVQRAESYGHQLGAWLKEVEPELTAAAENAPAALADALEVIQWYQYLPAAKLYRAVHRIDPEAELEDYERDDIQGSVKVALISLDRAVLAWHRLLAGAPHLIGGAAPLLNQAESLRAHAEAAFPDARNFIRPGLDEASTFVM